MGESAWEAVTARVTSWAERVPLAVNVADGPSRRDFALVKSILGARRVSPNLPPHWFTAADVALMLVRSRCGREAGGGDGRPALRLGKMKLVVQ